MTLHKKRVLITGANGGLGLATCVAAADEGAELVLACRTQAKADAARDHVLSAVPGANVVAVGGFDMLDPEGVRDAVRQLPAALLDAVFLQAGGWVWADSVQTLSFGDRVVEKTVAKNVLGAHATLGALVAEGKLRRGARVVVIGGEGARGVPGAIAKPVFGDVADFERYLVGDWTGRDVYTPIDALGVAKLCAALWSQRLAQEAEGLLDVVWFTPGLIGGTGGTAGMPAWKEFLFQRVAFPLMVMFGKAQWPEAAAAKCVDCIAGRVGVHGDLLGAPEGTALGSLTDQKPMSEHFVDAQFQAAIWQLCEAAAGAVDLAEVRRTVA